MSLFIWGGINLMTWFSDYQKTHEQFNQIQAPPGTFTWYIYGGLVISLMMLAFGLLGQITKSTLVGYLDGIALITVGLWNISFQLFLDDAVKPYGLKVVGWKIGDFTIWQMLGFLQCIWGLAQIYRFWRFGFHPRGLNEAVKTEASKKLQEIVQAIPSPDAGRFKLILGKKDFFDNLIMGNFIRFGTYTVWLMPDKAFCLEDELRDFFVYKRKSLVGRKFESMATDQSGHNRIKVPGFFRLLTSEITLNHKAQNALKEWMKKM